MKQVSKDLRELYTEMQGAAASEDIIVEDVFTKKGVTDIDIWAPRGFRAQKSILVYINVWNEIINLFGFPTFKIESSSSPAKGHELDRWSH